MDFLDKYRSYLERAYDRHGYGAISVVGRWWFLCIIPIFLVDADSVLGLPVFWVFPSIMMAGIAYSGWHLLGISIRRSNAAAQKQKDEEWERFNR
ncbi:hypothetical protein [Blastomonas sp. CACIA14H2]|uniref:hypothetical protein n=1 Tax=Blastomonas sp. CACIA14H2 TaxID=1419876 RepID=UPI0026B070B8